MGQATFSIRMDEALKQEFDELCTEFGMSATTAFNVFARSVVREKRIPFPIQSGQSKSAEAGMLAFESLRKQAQRNGVSDMSLEEINAEISSARKEAQG